MKSLTKWRISLDISAIILMISVAAAVVYGFVSGILWLLSLGAGFCAIMGGLFIAILGGPCAFALLVGGVEDRVSHIDELISGDAKDNLPSYADTMNKNPPSYQYAIRNTWNKPPSYADALRVPPSYMDTMSNALDNPSLLDSSSSHAEALESMVNERSADADGTPSATIENPDSEQISSQFKQGYSCGELLESMVNEKSADADGTPSATIESHDSEQISSQLKQRYS